MAEEANSIHPSWTADVPQTVWVIMRSTGEYSDRSEDPIRFCLSEADAQAAVTLTSIEAQQMDRPEYPQTESSYGWLMPDGTWGAFATGGKFVRKPNGDALDQASQDALANYTAACLLLGHVDPGGSSTDATYSYEAVTLWQQPGGANA